MALPTSSLMAVGTLGRMKKEGFLNGLALYPPPPFQLPRSCPICSYWLSEIIFMFMYCVFCRTYKRWVRVKGGGGAT